MNIIRFLLQIIQRIFIFCFTYIIILIGCTIMIALLHDFGLPDSHAVEAVYLTVILLITIVILVYIDLKKTIKKCLPTDQNSTNSNESNL